MRFSIHKFEISDRNMYVRRFLPAPLDDINRYRDRIAIAHPLTVKGHIWKPFASYEAFYDQGSGWTRDRVWAGVTVPLVKQVSFQPSYMWEGTNGIKDVNYLMFGLIVRTRDKDLNHFNTQKETSMSKVLQRGTAMLAVIASLVFATAALAQMPTSPWKKGAPFPEPDEELYGVARQRQDVRDRRLGRRQGWGRQLRVRPGHRQVDEETADAAAGPPCGPGRCERQDLRDAVASSPRRTPRSRVGAAWQPIDDAWEYDPAADSWKSLAPLPGKRGSAVAAEVGGKIYVIGGATTVDGVQGPVLHVHSDLPRFSAPTTCTTPPRTSGRAARRCRCRAITRSAAPSTARSTSSAAAPATPSS